MHHHDSGASAREHAALWSLVAEGTLLDEQRLIAGGEQLCEEQVSGEGKSPDKQRVILDG